MPEFIAELTPDNLPDDFTRAYLEAVEWLLSDSTDEMADCVAGTAIGSDRERATGFSDDAIKQATEDCSDFQDCNSELLERAYGHGYTESQAGVDFWLTRNRHGAGFWDRGLDVIGAELTSNAHAYGACDSYVGDDGLIYLT